MVPRIVGAFFALAAALVAIVAVTLLFPGGPLDTIWALKPDALGTLRRLPNLTGAGFVLLAAAFALTSLGCFRRKRWGWVLATAFVAINVASAVAGIFMEPSLENATGPAIGASILLWLVSPPVRKKFS
jgi:hypothetical protein